MNDLKFTLLTDGSSDRVLVRHLEWLVRRHIPRATTIQMEWADLRSFRPKPTNLTDRIQKAFEFYPADLLFVHRDAERQDPQLRYSEIQNAVESLASVIPSTVAVVPVRMQEAWLLFDEAAIRWAAGNPNGRQFVELPSISDLEDVADPKQVLWRCLRTASGLSGRRLKRFQTGVAARRVAEYIEDFSPLLELKAFRRLDSDIGQEVQSRGWREDRPEE
jgi:hypothetical protein